MTLLRAQDLTLKINQQTICHSLQFTLQRGEVWGILGPNGSGKTTLLHALAGLLPAQRANLFLHDKPLRDYSLQKIAQTIGILLQEMSTAFPQTVWEYCLAGRYPHLNYWKKHAAQDEEIAASALMTMDLAALRQRKIHELSGGEKRRLAIATLLTQTPTIYLLDEATNHLDVRHQLQTLTHFSKLAREHAAGIIMCMHDINQAQHYCEKILLLFPNGEIHQGNTHEMLTLDNLERLYQQPFKKITADNQCYWLSTH